jgi:capsular polysaccharide biosynthesis protein
MLLDQTSIRSRLDTPVQNTESDNTLTLKKFLQILWRRLWIIALVTIMFTAAATGFSLTQTPMYRATITILVGQEQGGSADTLARDVMGLQSLMETMAQAVSSRPIAEGTIEQLNLQTTPNALLGSVSVEAVPDTQFIQVSYVDPDPEQAKEIANAIGEVFSERVSDVSPDNITATVWEQAVEPQAPISPDPVRNALLAMVLGLMLGLGLAFLLEHLDDSWRSPEEAEQISGVPTFGVIPNFKTSRSRKKE